MKTQRYATPSDDLSAWREAPRAAGLLPPHVVAFLQGGVAPALGVRGCDGRPLIGAGVACRVDENELVRVLAPRRSNVALLAALEQGSAIAVTFSRARDHRSIQLKSPGAAWVSARPGDACEAARQTAILADELLEIGYSRSQAAGFVAHDPSDLVSIEFRPERVFTQTPGPGAGAEMVR